MAFKIRVSEYELRGCCISFFCVSSSCIFLNYVKESFLSNKLFLDRFSMQEEDLGVTVPLVNVLFEGIDSGGEDRNSGSDPARLLDQSRRVTGGRSFNGFEETAVFS